MADWYLAPSLVTLRAEINARWPNRDKASDGSIGDAAHQAGTSDHNPNERGSVNAIDVDEDGIDPYAVIEAFQRHPSAHYWIYEQQIADRDDGWRRRTYYGSNPHDHHAHFSIRQTRTAEQDTSPWGLLEDDMPTADEVATAVWGRTATDPTDGGTQPMVNFVRYTEHNVRQQIQEQVHPRLDELSTKLDALAAKLDALGQQTPPAE